MRENLAETACRSPMPSLLPLSLLLLPLTSGCDWCDRKTWTHSSHILSVRYSCGTC